MKLTNLLTVGIVGIMATACSDDVPSPDKNEDYTRTFIKDFGVPEKGHDYSIATTAGLKVKASQPASIVITATIDGDEYYFGRMTVEAGETPVPVTIPKNVTQLNLHIDGDIYTVNSDGIVDLDRLTAGSRRLDIDYNDDPDNDVYGDKNTIALRFNYTDLLAPYFKKYPIGETATEEPTRKPDWNGNELPDWQTYLGSSKESPYTYYIFPIYVQRCYQGQDPDRLIDDYSLQMSYNTPKGVIGEGFPYGKDSEGSLLRDHIFFSNTADKNTANQVTVTHNDANVFGQTPSGFTACSEDNLKQMVKSSSTDNLVIESQGFELNVKSDTYTRFTLRSSLPTLSFVSSGVTNWGCNVYYPATLDKVSSATAPTRRVMLKEIINPGTLSIPANDVRSTLDIDNAFILGYCDTPKKANDKETIRDYSNVLLLVIPTNEKNEQGNYKRSIIPVGNYYKPYKWLIAAEDLGGSFDWDFNDIVFEFTDVVDDISSIYQKENADETDGNLFVAPLQVPTDAVNVRTIEVTPLAAGGTLPAYIAFNGYVTFNDIMSRLTKDGSNDYYTKNQELKDIITEMTGGTSYPTEGSHTFILGKEIHHWLGASTHANALNANSITHTSDRSIRFYTNLSSYNTTTGGGSDWLHKSNVNRSLLGFSVIVDKDNTIAITTHEENGYKQIDDYKLGNDYFIGSIAEGAEYTAPQMICIPANRNWAWPKEGVNIGTAYPNFRDWVADSKATDWVNGAQSGNVVNR